MAVFNRIYDLMMYRLEQLSLGKTRRDLLQIASGKILEIGSGTGANLDKFRPGSKIVFTDPDAEMVGRLHRKMKTLGINAKVTLAAAEELPFSDASFDSVVSTLVLCSVGDLDLALQEVWRVLKPGGKLLFIEHVRSRGLRARFQDRLTPLWSWFAEGCRMNRCTVEAMSKAGFEIIRADHFNPAEKIWLINSWPVQLFLPFVRGFAVKKVK